MWEISLKGVKISRKLRNSDSKWVKMPKKTAPYNKKPILLIWPGKMYGKPAGKVMLRAYRDPRYRIGTFSMGL